MSRPALLLHQMTLQPESIDLRPSTAVIHEFWICTVQIAQCRGSTNTPQHRRKNVLRVTLQMRVSVFAEGGHVLVQNDDAQFLYVTKWCIYGCARHPRKVKETHRPLLRWIWIYFEDDNSDCEKANWGALQSAGFRRYPNISINELEKSVIQFTNFPYQAYAPTPRMCIYADSQALKWINTYHLSSHANLENHIPCLIYSLGIRHKCLQLHGTFIKRRISSRAYASSL